MSAFQAWTSIVGNLPEKAPLWMERFLGGLHVLDNMSLCAA